MNEHYSIWAPNERVWSQWAKPVLFAFCRTRPPTAAPSSEWPVLPLSAERATALLLDLPREQAILHGIGAARAGHWPVPLFNCADGPGATLSLARMLERLAAGTKELSELRNSLPADAPPAFLVDSRRMAPDRPLEAGSFDNRYILLPQDFPSAGFLTAHGVRRILWLRSAVEQPDRFGKERTGDLAHVLRRWQDGGLEIRCGDVETGQTEAIRVKRPSLFKSLFYRASALAGLRRNSAGGFGGIIPESTAG